MLKNQILFAFVLWLCGCFFTTYARGKCPPIGKKLTPQQYVEKYLAEAQRQMDKYGIPASITLAQGMYESGYGSSYLAAKANNHFGIKAYSRGWKGPVVRCDDDDYDEPFCKFSSVKEGYEYHSIFLKQPRYAPLFELKLTDYRGWAKGLRKCGYATNPRYAEVLIRIIEENKLYIYDQPTKRFVLRPHQLFTTKERRGLKYVRAHEDDDLKAIAEEFDVSARKLRKWNDFPKRHVLKAGDIVYLQSKRSKADKGYKVHVVRAGESLLSISQLYGVKVKSLIRRNKLDDATVKVGQEIKLR